MQHTTITVTGRLHDGNFVSQDLTLSHQDGVDEAKLIGQVLGIVRQAGGIMVGDGQVGLSFYPLHTFKRLDFRAHLVVRATATATN